MLTPVDLETIVFRRGFRGYQVREVQEFMNRLIQDYERLYRENIELKEEIEKLGDKLSNYVRTEATMHNALLLAEKTAEEVRRASHLQAEVMLKEAENRAEHVRLRVREEIRAELESLAYLKRQTDFIRMQLRNFIGGLAELAERQLNFDATWNGLFKKPGEGEAGQEGMPAPIPGPSPEGSVEG